MHCFQKVSSEALLISRIIPFFSTAASTCCRKNNRSNSWQVAKIMNLYYWLLGLSLLMDKDRIKT
ncbi:MAG: hypothetical protein K0R08_2275 [Solimicrobium sp.]|nr:hypothetical protein [Solimicrobium sp.]